MNQRSYIKMTTRDKLTQSGSSLAGLSHSLFWTIDIYRLTSLARLFREICLELSVDPKQLRTMIDPSMSFDTRCPERAITLSAEELTIGKRSLTAAGRKAGASNFLCLWRARSTVGKIRISGGRTFYESHLLPRRESGQAVTAVSIRWK